MNLFPHTFLLAVLIAIVLALPALAVWSLAYPGVALAPAFYALRAWLRIHGELSDFVAKQEGRSPRPRITYLVSKDGSIPLVRMPSGQVRSMKKLRRKFSAAQP